MSTVTCPISQSEKPEVGREGMFICQTMQSTYQENNETVLNITKVIKHMVTPAASVGALFINTRQAMPARRLFEKMGHKQPPTPTQTDNPIAIAFITKKLNPKMIKAEDMNHGFLRDQQDRERFRCYWRENKLNDWEYQSKHHCGARHQ